MQRILAVVSATAVGLLVSAAPSAAQTTTACGANGVTLQAAITAAPAGDTIAISDSECTGIALAIPAGKDLTIQGAPTTLHAAGGSTPAITAAAGSGDLVFRAIDIDGAAITGPTPGILIGNASASVTFDNSSASGLPGDGAALDA